MLDPNHKEDYALAQKICSDLKVCLNEAILTLYHKHHRFFLAYARRRIFNADPDQIEAVLSNFWTTLLDSKAICSYEGKASLRTFLLTILNRRIIDANRQFQRDMKLAAVIDGQMPHHASNIPDYEETAEDLLLKKECKKVIHDTLVQLSKKSPKDAAFIRMHLNGLSYKKMAEQDLNTRKIETHELKKRVDSIKKQFTRPVTGSLARFKVLLEESLRENRIDPGDLFGW